VSLITGLEFYHPFQTQNSNHSIAYRKLTVIVLTLLRENVTTGSWFRSAAKPRFVTGVYCDSRDAEIKAIILQVLGVGKN